MPARSKPPPGAQPPEEDEMESQAARKRILLVGAGLAGLLLVEFAVILLLDAKMAGGLARMVGVEILLGREAGIPHALIDGGAPWWLVIQVSFAQDMAAVALVFPLALKVLDSSRKRGNWLGRRIEAIDATARKKEKWARRWGPLGIFAFMLVPFISNGPLLGALLGRSAGIPVRRLILPIASATLLSVTAWTLFYQALKSFVESLDSRFTWFVSLAVLALAVFGFLTIGRKEEGKGAGSGRPPEKP